MIFDTSIPKTQKRQIKRFENGTFSAKEDLVAIEAPLEIHLQKESEISGKSVAVTMRTPGNDAELVLGFLFTEGILSDFNSIVSTSQLDENIVTVLVKDDTAINLSQSDRNFYTTSSCGVCGKASIDAIKVSSIFKLAGFSPKVKPELLFGLQEKLLEQQSTFAETGGIHAAALFNIGGELELLKEDVGRHNALDKLIGNLWSQGMLPASNHILLLSGRASFELVQKATMAGIPVIVAVGAPSSLAIELAENNQHTLIGFLKKQRFNCYTGHERIEE